MQAIATDMRVADLMTIDPVAISVDASIEDAEELFREHRITGLPVVGADGRLVGVISLTDLLYLAVPTVQALIRHHERGIRVGEVMSTPPVTIDSAATLREAARLMHEDRLHRLVAVNAAGQPIGVISAMDFVALAAEGWADPEKVDVVEAVKRITGGIGADVAIEALGLQVTFESALRCVRAGGTVSSLGVYSGKLQMPYEALAAGLGDHMMVTTLCPGGMERMGRLTRMVESGRFHPKPMITHRFALSEIGEAYRIFSNRLDGVLKVVIRP